MTGQQLKNSILQLAVQGKLVPQDPTDKPASILLERIREEKEQLIREKKIKHEKNPSHIFRGEDGHFYERIGKNAPVCIDEELPFEIPETWEWARLGTISTYAETKKKIKAQDAELNLWGLDLEDIEKGGKLLTRKTVGERKAIGDKTYFQQGDILYSKLRPYLLKILIAPESGICTPELVPFSLYGEISSEFIVAFLKCPYVNDTINAVTYGVKMPRVNTATMISLLVPLPPLAEQQRIVAKIEELLPYVERYEQSQNKLEKLNTTFPDQLKKSILQEAVQGKLVPQDPADEPASILLERIRAEKDQLIKDGKIKREKNPSHIFRGEDGHFYERIGKAEPVCIDEELPFEIPETWEWARLGTALINRDAERIPLSVNERQKLEKIYDYYGASGVIDKVDNFLFDKPLLLIGEDGANLLLRSKPIAFIAKGKYWVNNHAHVLDAIDNTLLEYIALYINAINLAPYVTGTAQPKMNQQKMHSILLTIPPLKEQKRIIAQYNILNQTLEKLYRKD